MDVLRKFFFYRYEFLIKCLLYMFSVLLVLFIEKKFFWKLMKKIWLLEMVFLIIVYIKEKKKEILNKLIILKK